MSKVVPIGGSRIGNFIHFELNPLDFLTKAREIGDVVALNSSRRRAAYVVNSPEFIREILTVKEKSFRKGRSSDVLGKTVGEGLLTSEGAVHEKQRRIMQSAFHIQKMADYADDIVDCTNALLQSWDDGEERLISKDMMDLTLNSIVRTMFGTDIGKIADRITEAIDTAITFSAKRLMSPIAIPSYLPTRGNLVHKQALQVLNQTVYSIIAEAKSRPQEGQENLLTMLLGDMQEGQHPLHEQEIRDQIMTILIAGHETTANALTWTLYLISTHPEVEKKFFQELDDVLGENMPTIAHLPNLTYLQLILQESMRLYPPAWMILREANEPVEICGYSFPADSSMIICPFTVHRNPLFFDNPNEFKPERFAEESIKNIPRYAYFPFGGGSRACIGNNFAMMEAKLVIATIGKKYHFRMPANHHPIQPEPSVSLRIKDGLRMKIFQRLT